MAGSAISKRCSGDLIFLSDQLVYPVTESKMYISDVVFPD